MNKTPEQMIAEGEVLIAAGKAKKAATQGNQTAPVKNHEASTGVKPSPVTGFYPKKPKRPGFTPTQICGLPLTEEQVKKLK
jgi:hypothetical protein